MMRFRTNVDLNALLNSDTITLTDSSDGYREKNKMTQFDYPRSENERGSIAPQRVGEQPVQFFLEALEEKTQELYKAIGELESRLAVVILPLGKGGIADPTADEHLNISPLAERIRGDGLRIKGAIDTINDIARRLNL